MADTATDIVKVKYAALLPPEADGAHLLKLKTTEDVEINFRLDDIAVATLALFAGIGASGLKHRVGDDPEKLRAYDKEGNLK